MTMRRELSTGTPRRESGTVTLWLLGVCMLLFALGGISVDLWRGFSARRSLSNAADAAALAGASAIDEDAYRRSGAVQLDPVLAESRARDHVTRQLDAAALRDGLRHTACTGGGAADERSSITVKRDPSSATITMRQKSEPPFDVTLT